MANECEQFSFEICGRQYKMWCKKDKIEQANYIVDKIKPIIEKVANKNQVLSFEKILVISMIEILSKEKEFRIEKEEEKTKQSPINDQNEFEEKLKQQREQLINEFAEILQTIQTELEE